MHERERETHKRENAEDEKIVHKGERGEQAREDDEREIWREEIVATSHNNVKEGERETRRSGRSGKEEEGDGRVW